MNLARAHGLFRLVRDRAYTGAVRSSFADLGPHTRISLPIQIDGSERIAIGHDVYLGPGCWLLTHPARQPGRDSQGTGGGRLEIGHRTSIAGYCVLSAAVHVCIGDSVLLARNVYVADHRHGFDREDVPVLDQPLGDLRPVTIADGAWLGQNVVILPGVTVGQNAVVGANSVVRDDVPAGCVAVGAPARVVRRINDSERQQDPSPRLTQDANSSGDPAGGGPGLRSSAGGPRRRSKQR